MLFLVSMVFASCSFPKKKRIINFPTTDLTTTHLIPKPLEVYGTASGFALDQFTVIHTSKNTTEVGEFLAQKIHFKIGLELPVNSEFSETAETVIFINQSDHPDLNKSEAYQISISEDSIIINSNTEVGAFRSIQTLRQLIPEKSNDTLTENNIWVIPTGKIIDAPHFEYRATMLDVARHFFALKM